MKFIVGIGNPDKKYEGTRHNVGFDVIDLFADRENLRFKKFKSQALIAIYENSVEKVALIKPLTYVNQSGTIVKPLMGTYNVSNSELFFICDDINLPLGKIRIRKSGSSGGHKGLKSIIDALETKEFNRLRIGVDNPNVEDVAEYVLDKFSNAERKIIDESIYIAYNATKVWIKEGIEKCMNQFNSKGV